MKKRGQVSVFAIIGIVIVVGAILVIIVNEKTSIFKPSIKRPEIVSIKNYAESCMKKSLEEGLNLMMMQGGYVNPEESLPDTRFDAESYIEHGYKVPLWYYKYRPRMPSKRDMEIQLEDKIRNEFDSCTNNFTAFKETFDISFEEEKKISVSINKEDAASKLQMPLLITDKQNNKEVKLSEFMAKAPSSLGKLYSLASQIIETEEKEQFLETLTDEIIAASDQYPYEGMEISCKPKRWYVSDIRDLLVEDISFNLNMITFENTKFTPVGMQYYDKLFRIKATTQNFRDVEVKTMFNPSWGIDLKIIPSKDGVVKPISITPQASGSPADYLASGLLGLCFKVYHHKYSLNYNVLFMLTDTKNPGETFFFATPVMLKDNIPDRRGTVIGLPTDIDTEGSESYCSKEYEITEYVIDPVTNHILSYPEQKRQKIFYPVNVYVTDSHTDEFLPNVSISYQCIRFLCKNIGETWYPIVNDLVVGSIPYLKAEFPPCENGYFVAEKNGYLMATRQQTVDSNVADTNLQMSLIRMKQLKYEFRILEKKGATYVPRMISPDESVLVMISTKDPEYSTVIYYPHEVKEFETFNLMVGNFEYDVQMRIFVNDTITGGAEFTWNPDTDDVVNKDALLIFAVNTGVITDLSEENPVWKTAIDESKRHRPMFI
ncbi:hypothetical protein JXA85_03895 [Candidatus Woesearchaeota archaeon]|nr:hypothetical protein [Candidatus Woesearchaeota archaeon]